MKTADNQFQLLLDQTIALYNSEKEVSGIFEALRINTREPHLKKAITLEEEENKKYCTRLEGLLRVLSRHPHKNCTNKTSWKNFVNEFSATLQRIVLKHSEFGYRTAIFTALALGQNEIADFLKCCLSHGSVVVIK